MNSENEKEILITLLEKPKQRQKLKNDCTNQHNVQASTIKKISDAQVESIEKARMNCENDISKKECKGKKSNLDFLPIKTLCPFCPECSAKKDIAYNCNLLFVDDEDFCLNCVEKEIKKSAVLTFRDEKIGQVQKRVFLIFLQDKEEIKNTKLKEAAKEGKLFKTKKSKKKMH